MALNAREKKFVANYLKYGEAYQAALAAGYKKYTAKDSSKWINPDILNNPNERERKKFKPAVYAAIKEKANEIEDEDIADAKEVMRYLTSVMRKQSKASVLARDETGADRVIEKPPDEKEALRAGELLGKRYCLFTDRIEQDIDMDLNISVDYGDAE